MSSSKIKEIINIRKIEYQNYCLKNDKPLKLPKLLNNLKNEAILIEFRLIPYIQFVIKKFIFYLGDEWSFTIICGNINFDFINKIIKDNNLNIKIIKKNINNLTREEYSVMLLNSKFWKQFVGEKLLLYQEDSLIFRKIDKYFLEYDYIGAPFYNKDVGNGGFSLRSKSVMIEICKKFFDINSNRYNKDIEYIKKYKGSVNYNYDIEKNLLEDLQITNIMRRYNIGRLASFEIAKKFSIEKYYYDNSIGGHQFWYCVKNIVNFLDEKYK